MMSETSKERILSPDEVLRVENLKVWFPLKRGIGDFLKGIPRRYVRAVDGISFSLKEKETFCLVGESGCGKTTTGKAVMRLVPITDGRIYVKVPKTVAEDLWVLGADILSGNVLDLATVPDRAIKPMRRVIQMVYQDPYASLNPRFTVRQILEEPLMIHGIALSREERIEIIAKILETVKLVPPEEFMERYPHQLSGGQRQRVAFARAIIVNPKITVADEPVSMLDVSIRAEILELMEELKERFGVTYIFITHDLAVARYICDRIAVMYLGKFVEVADARRLIEKPFHPYTKALIAAIPEPDPENRKHYRNLRIRGEVPSAVNIPPGCRFHPRCIDFEERRNELSEHCTVKEPPMLEIEKDHYVSCWLYAKR